jgi:hypothetical protein
MKRGKISMAVSCTFAPVITLTGNMGGSYSSAAFEMTGSMHSQGSAASEVSASMSARRIGVCQR